MLITWILACAGPEGLPDRDPTDRTPPSAACDPLDPVRCFLPWPSNTFTVADPSTVTGLRLAVDPAQLTVDDDPSFLNLADGFSRITGVAFGFEEPVDVGVVSTEVEASLELDGVLQVINLQPGSPRRLQRQAFWTELRDGSTLSQERWLLVGRPEEVLEANADHAAVVLDSIGTSQAPRLVQVALGLLAPTTDDEEAARAWYAPVAAGLEEAGVPLGRVVRLTAFTTRSAADATGRTRSMMATLDGALDQVIVEVDSVSFPSHPTLAAVVRGRLTGVPGFLDDDGQLVFDDAGHPLVTGSTAVEFRISLPAGEGAYRVALYGHGTGGDVTDSAFDEELADAGVAKLNLRFDGWTGEDFVYTLASFTRFFEGSARSTAGLMQSVAGGTALLTALDGALGEVLRAEELGGVPNPVAARSADTTDVPWLGGSLGATVGAVIVAADPRLRTAVLNVPGSGWTHMIPYSLLYDAGVGTVLLEQYGDVVDLHLGLIMAQGAWDDVDGAVWADEALAVGGTFLLQESMGDRVLPNLGTNLLARALGAVQLTPSLDPIVAVEGSPGPVFGGAVLEQFRVPNTGAYDVHGFAARNTVAADAAMEQFIGLLTTAWEGNPTVERASLCLEQGLGGTCDFSEAWTE